MASVYSILMFQGEVPTSPAACFTVPDGYVYVVRDLDAVGPGTSPWVLMSELVEDQNFASVPAVENGSSDNYSYTWRGRQVFNPGQQLGLGAQFDLVFARVSGYQLALP